MDDQEARQRLEQVFDANRRGILGYALRRVREPADAADIVAETFLVAWRRIGEIPNGDAERLWLFGVARNVVANHQRGALRRTRLSERLRAEVTTAVRFTFPANASSSEVGDALRRLPSDDREILTLMAWEGLEAVEIGLVLGIPPATVRTRLHRARRRLRAELDRPHGPAPPILAANPAAAACSTRTGDAR